MSPISNTKILMYYLAWSSLLIALLYSVAPSIDWVYLKDGAIIAVLALSARKIRVQNNPIIISVIFALPILILYSYAISPAEDFAKIASIRQLIMPFIIFAVGYISINKYSDYQAALKTLVSIALIMCAFGVFERLLHLWTLIDISRFFISKKIPVFEYGYPIFFIEPISIMGWMELPNGIPRMVSSFLDPINLGHTLVFFICVVMYDTNITIKKSRMVGLLLILFLCLALTLSKGAWLELFLVTVALNSRGSITLKLIALLMAIPAIFIYAQSHAGFMIHLNGFIGVFSHITAFGHGLSTFGNYSAMFNTSGQIAQGVGDSFWGSLLGQLGLIGFILWMLPFVAMISRLGLKHYLSKIILAQLIVSALSENAFNLMSIAYPLLTIGMYCRAKKYAVEYK
ncbi:hypothetical protein [Pseudomonas sp. LB3P31]